MISPLKGFSPAAKLSRPQPPAPPAPPEPTDQVQLTRSKKVKLYAVMGLAMTASSLIPAVAAVTAHPAPVVYQCLSGQITEAHSPSLLDQILHHSQAPKARAVMACEGVSQPGQLQQPANRAAFAWESLTAKLGNGPTTLNDHVGSSGATAWPYGQAMVAALDQAKLSGDYTQFDQMVEHLESYRNAQGGYNPTTRGGERYYDDNAWIGLALMQAYHQNPQPQYLAKAESVAQFIRTGITGDGGLLWKEKAARPTYNTCAFGPSIELFMHLYQATGHPQDLQTAQQLDRFMDAQLRLPGGLYGDNRATDLNSPLDAHIYAYNQGTPAGAKLLLYEATGDTQYLRDAQQTARAALSYYEQGERLWQEAPAFSAIMFRNLLQVPGVDARPLMNDYLERNWREALDPQSGLFERSAGQGSYDKPKGFQMIDQAALTQLYALQAWNPAELGQVT
ncbi:MAG: glycoside hydrolase family 76 protein [Vulcanimicrobiota bacterium]